ncbi:MAG: hypothetical protein KJ052_08860 [Candidatus Hydrogenedentes bacterium]|nr:hypothetical protein [Candidatus Hydrogenedentota bacterium]
MKRAQIFGAGLLLCGLSLLVPWSEYTGFQRHGSIQTSHEVVRPYPFFLDTYDKKISWSRVAIQTGVILFASAGLALCAGKSKE